MYTLKHILKSLLTTSTLLTLPITFAAGSESLNGEELSISTATAVKASNTLARLKNDIWTMMLGASRKDENGNPILTEVGLLDLSSQAALSRASRAFGMQTEATLNAAKMWGQSNWMARLLLNPIRFTDSNMLIFFQSVAGSVFENILRAGSDRRLTIPTEGDVAHIEFIDAIDASGLHAQEKDLLRNLPNTKPADIIAAGQSIAARGFYDYPRAVALFKSVLTHPATTAQEMVAALQSLVTYGSGDDRFEQIAARCEGIANRSDVSIDTAYNAIGVLVKIANVMASDTELASRAASFRDRELPRYITVKHFAMMQP